jgi:hypothetical protein
LAPHAVGLTRGAVVDLMQSVRAFFEEHDLYDTRAGEHAEAGLDEYGAVWLRCRCGATFGEPGRWRVIQYLERMFALGAR